MFTGRSCPSSGLAKAVGSKETPILRLLVTNVCPPGPCWNCCDIEFLWVWTSASPVLPLERGSWSLWTDRELVPVVHPHQGTMKWPCLRSCCLTATGRMWISCLPSPSSSHTSLPWCSQRSSPPPSLPWTPMNQKSLCHQATYIFPSTEILS